MNSRDRVNLINRMTSIFTKQNNFNGFCCYRSGRCCSGIISISKRSTADVVEQHLQMGKHSAESISIEWRTNEALEEAKR